MQTDLSPEQIRRYQEDGFLIIDSFLDPDELDAWRDAVEAAVAARADRRLADGRIKDDELDDYARHIFVQRVNLWQDDERMRSLVTNEAIGKMVASLEGVDGVRVVNDQALFKMPWANPTAWHLDTPFWSTSSRHAATIWIALDNATLENGCLYFIPGSHKRTRLENVKIGKNLGDLFDVYPELKTMQAVPSRLKAGSCSVHNGLIAHAAGPNMTPGMRRAMTIAYMPEGSTYNGAKNWMTEEQAARFQVGDPLDDDSLYPLVFSQRGS